MISERLLAYTLFFAFFVALPACSKGPDPWSPKTYPLEVKPYQRDYGALGPEWKKHEIKGMEDNSFFFAHDALEAVISVYFTCGKYHDISVDKLAEHLIIPMGRKPEIIVSRRLAYPRAELYHLAARGEYQYHKETLYKEEGLVPDLKADMVVDAYVIEERHCVVDLVYTAPPDEYESGLDDFHAYLSSLGVPVDEAFDVSMGSGGG